MQRCASEETMSMNLPLMIDLPHTRVVIGVGVMAAVGERARALGMQHALIVTDPHFAGSPVLDAVCASLAACDIATTRYTDALPDPSDASVAAAAQAYHRSSADGVVALGGGSSIDTAKALGILAHAATSRIDTFYLGTGRAPAGRPPLICLPTTAGTGSEVTEVAVVTDAALGRKMVVRHPIVAPDVALIDPALSRTMPPALTAATGSDALAHAIEALTSSMANPVADALASAALQRVIAALPAACRNGADLAARTEMSTAALLAGLAFNSARLHLGHAVGHALGTRYHLPHGIGCVVCLPAIVGFLAPACPAATAGIAAAFGTTVAELPAVITAFLRAVGIAGLATWLSADQPDITALAQLIAQETRLIALSPRQPTLTDWAAMLGASLDD
jgi:alcohol dehydrogenase class IV